MPDNVSSIIKQIFKEDIHKDGVNWKAVTGDHKKEYFQKFKNHFRCNPSVEPAVRTAFMKQAAVRYRYMMTTFKNVLGFRKPNCLCQEIWEKWLAYWSLPEVIEKSEKARLGGARIDCSRHS